MGFWEVDQHIPLFVIALPPSETITPPLLAVVDPTADIETVVNDGALAASVVKVS